LEHTVLTGDRLRLRKSTLRFGRRNGVLVESQLSPIVGQIGRYYPQSHQATPDTRTAAESGGIQPSLNLPPHPFRQHCFVEGVGAPPGSGAHRTVSGLGFYLNAMWTAALQ
jgi:hypothetical protein